MRTNSAIPIVQQKGGALIYKYHCADLKELHNYAKELEYNTVIHFIIEWNTMSFAHPFLFSLCVVL